MVEVLQNDSRLSAVGEGLSNEAMVCVWGAVVLIEVEAVKRLDFFGRLTPGNFLTMRQNLGKMIIGDGGVLDTFQEEDLVIGLDEVDRVKRAIDEILSRGYPERMPRPVAFGEDFTGGEAFNI